MSEARVDPVQEFRQAQAQGFGLGGGGDELLQVAQAPLRLQGALLFQHLHVARLHQHPAHQGRQPQHPDLPPGLGEQVQVAPQFPLGPALELPRPQQRRHPVQGRAALGDGRLDARQGGGAHPPHRGVHRAPEADQVEGVAHQAQVRQQVLHLLALVELDAAHQLVRDVLGPQGLFQQAGLPVGPVQDRQAPARVVPAFLLDPLHHVVRLQAPLVKQLEGDAVPRPQVGPQGLAQALGVVGDDRAGGVQDLLGGAVVLFQLDLHRLREVPLEVQDVADVGPAPPINALIFITNHT